MAYRKYTREQLAEVARNSLTMSDVLRQLGLRLAGGTHAHIKRRLAAYEIDTTHFVGSRANRGEGHVGGPATAAWQEVLVLRSPESRRERSHRLRRALMELGRAYRCEVCGQAPVWNGQRLVLQVDHINGVPHDWRPENLRFICPNCHSQTLNFGVRNYSRAEVA